MTFPSTSAIQVVSACGTAANPRGISEEVAALMLAESRLERLRRNQRHSADEAATVVKRTEETHGQVIDGRPQGRGRQERRQSGRPGGGRINYLA